MSSSRTRLAPSPTGSLHLGNIFSFLINWAIARQNNWTITLRIEDIDGPRKKTNTISQLLDELQWLGINWDEEPVIQSENLKSSQAMLQNLIAKDLVYHCSLSRKELKQVLSAPHSDNSLKQPSNRPSNIKLHNANKPNEQTNWRFISNQKPQTIRDELLGIQTYTSKEDFVVWTKSNVPAYQLAVVADDYRQDITHVVRGNDLMQSAFWQEQLYEAMNWRKPSWLHLPLIVGPDGKRLAKRHGDSRITLYRSRNVSPERIIGLIAMWTNTQQHLHPMTLASFLDTFAIQKVPTSNIMFTKEDETWLLE